MGTKSRKRPGISSKYYYDEEAAERAVSFFPDCLVHLESTPSVPAGSPFILEPWEAAIVRKVFGWKHRDTGYRRYRVVYIEIPRKNGKSTFAAGLALLLLIEKEHRARIYSAAGDLDQAGLVFGIARDMVKRNPELQQYIKPYRNSLLVPEGLSSYRPISRAADTKHGFNAHGIIYDELHCAPSRELWDTLVTSTGSRPQPLIVVLTTAGWDRHSICYELHDYALKVNDPKDDFQDEQFLGIIYAAPEDADWTDPKVWRKCNPNLGVTVTERFLQAECARAQAIPAYQNTFRRLYLNQWTEQESRWLDMRTWDACAWPVDWRKLKGRICYGGLDLSTNIDLTAFVLVFPPEDPEGLFEALCWFWMPEENIRGRILRDKVPYDVWVRDGFVIPTPGDTVDHMRVAVTMEGLGDMFDIQEIAFDRWGAEMMVNVLDGMGFTVVRFGQGYQSMSPPSKELERLVLSHRLAHGGNPVLRWNAGNIVVKVDPTSGIKPDKAKSTERIDGMVALIMALSRACVNTASVYESQGIRTV